MSCHAQDLPDLRGATILLPNYHVAQPLAQALGAISGSTLLLPRMVTLSDWALSIFLDTPVQPDTQRITSLYQALRERRWFADADLWSLSRELLGLMDELTRHQVALPKSADDFSRQLADAYSVRSGQAMPGTAGHAVTWDADIPAYLPEAHVKVAHEEHLCITLHMVKARAVADPSNQHWIRHYCETYPDMQLILAHAARGFNPYHTIEGLAKLTGLPNLWCDMAAVADVGACEAIIETLGHDRLLYGTDFPISHLRGRCVAIGDGFVWLYDDTLDWKKVSFQPLEPVFVGLESLRVLKQAAWHCRLGDSQVEDLFCNNARRLLGLTL